MLGCREYDLEYAIDMERITATFDARTAAAIRRAAGERGVSAFLQEAARERLARLELLQILDDLDARYGAPDADVAREVDREAEAIFGKQPSRGRSPARPPARRQKKRG